jgi:hypothetical protein
MAEYINIKGQSIEVVASDPANPTIGQIWYNSTSNTLKGQSYQVAAWSTGGNMGTARQGLTGFGTQTAAIGAGGYTTTAVTTSESYDGTTWTSTPSLPGVKRGINNSGAGTQAAGYVVGGLSTAGLNTTDEWNGSSWSGSGSYPITAFDISSMGTQTAGLTGAGEVPAPPVRSVVSAEYNGSTWTAGNPVTIGRYGAGKAGIQTAGLIFAGNVPSPAFLGATESYDGTSWTNLPATTVTHAQYMFAAGTQTAALKAGGEGQPNYASSEIFDGTSWSSITAMPFGKYIGGPAGTTSAALVFGGYRQTPAGNTNSTFAWNEASPVTVTITAS